MDTSKLVAARDKLNADIGTLVAATNVDQAAIDKLTDETTSLDNDVLAAFNQIPPTPIDFASFDAAVLAFKTDTKLTQSNVDDLTVSIISATV